MNTILGNKALVMAGICLWQFQWGHGAALGCFAGAICYTLEWAVETLMKKE